MSEPTIETFIRQPEHLARLNQWIFENTRPYIKGRALEIGSGTGDFTSLLVEQNIPVHLNAVSETNRNELIQRFQDSPSVRAVHRIDFARPDFEQAYANFKERFGAIIAVNITDRLFLERSGIKNAWFLLRNQGRLLLVVPAPTVNFPGAEEDPEGISRQNRKQLKLLLQDFEIRRKKHFILEDSEWKTSFSSTRLFSLVVCKKNIP